MLSQTTEYALRAVVVLAREAPLPQTVEQIAQRTRVPGAYLSKVLQSLSRAGLVSSQRGIHGGFTLARSAEQVTLLDVVEAVATFKRIEQCPLGLVEHGVRLCPLHKRLDQAVAIALKAFQETTLAEILSEPSASVPLCPFPGELRSRPPE